MRCGGEEKYIGSTTNINDHCRAQKHIAKQRQLSIFELNNTNNEGTDDGNWW